MSYTECSVTNKILQKSQNNLLNETSDFNYRREYKTKIVLKI